MKNLPPDLPLEAHEKIVLQQKKHWIYHFRAVVLVVFWILLFFLMPEVSGAGMVVFLIFVLMGGGIFIFWWLDDRDELIITDKKVIFCQQVGLFNREITQVKFEKLEDVQGKVSGVLGHILKFGILELQSAGAKNKLKMTLMPDPFGLSRKIFETKDG